MKFLLPIGALITGASLVMYPPVYDLLYYHYAAFVWTYNRINPYLDLVTYHQNNHAPFLEIPILHNYAYGPLWLGISTLITFFTKGSFIIFALVLRLITIISFAGNLWLIKKLKSEISFNELFLITIFNPIIILFVLPGAHSEIIQTFFLLIGIFYAKRNNIFYSTLGFVFATLVKPSSLPLLILAVNWLFIHNLHQSNFLTTLKKITSQAIFPMILILTVIGCIFGFHLGYFKGVFDFISIERAAYGGFGGVLAFLLISILPLKNVPQIIIVNIVQSFFSLLYLFIFAYLNLKIIVKLRPSFNQFTSYLWLASLLTIFFSGAIVKPWYYTIPLFISLLDKSKVKTTILATIFIMLGSLYLHITYYFSETAKFANSVTASYFMNLIPFMLVLGLYLPKLGKLLYKIDVIQLLTKTINKLTR